MLIVRVITKQIWKFFILTNPSQSFLILFFRLNTCTIRRCISWRLILIAILYWIIWIIQVLSFLCMLPQIFVYNWCRSLLLLILSLLLIFRWLLLLIIMGSTRIVLIILVLIIISFYSFISQGNNSNNMMDT